VVTQICANCHTNTPARLLQYGSIRIALVPLVMPVLLEHLL